jgi:ketosteroid isomerase-like protein
MNFMKTLIVTFSFSLFSLLLLAQEKKDKKQEVEQAVTMLRQAIIDGDKAKLEQLTDSELTYGHSAGKIENKQQFVEALSSGKSDFSTMDITDQTVIVKGKTAIVRHKIAANVTDAGVANSVKLGVMLVFVKDDKQWKLLGRQAVKLPN